MDVLGQEGTASASRICLVWGQRAYGLVWMTKDEGRYQMANAAG